MNEIVRTPFPSDRHSRVVSELQAALRRVLPPELTAVSRTGWKRGRFEFAPDLLVIPRRAPDQHVASIVDTGQIIRFPDLKKTMTATEASRRFSDLLDAIERGETVTTTRGNRPVAQIGPPRRRTGADLRAALAEIPPPDGAFTRDVESAMSLLTTDGDDPWADA